MQNDESQPLTVNETAKLLGRSTEQIRRYLREGVLPGQRIGGQWFVARAAVEVLRRRHEGAPARRLTASASDPLGATIAIGRSGGGNIASGRVRYLRALDISDQR
jgi:excisionase family DNA binding protein